MLMNVLEHHNPVGCAAHSSRGRGLVGNAGEAVSASGSEPGHPFRGNQWTQLDAAHRAGAKAGSRFDHDARKFWSAVNQGDADAPDYEPFSPHSLFFEAGLKGLPHPKWVKAVRIGKLPEHTSTNFAEGKREPGVSVLHLHGEKPTDAGTFEMFNPGKKYNVEGWLHHKTGSDGEPLLVGARYSESTKAVDHESLLSAVRAERLARRIEAIKAKDGDTRNVAKAVVKDEDGLVLLLRDAHYGSWDLPGGHLTEGESYEDGLRREVREETGLEIISETRREDHDNGIIYDATVAGRKPHVTLSDEHNDYKWVQEGKAKDMSAFWLGGYEGHAAVRSEAQATISRAVGRIVLLAEANAIARKGDSEFLDYATLIMAAALATAYGKAANDLANLATGEDRGESLTHNEEMEYAKGRQNVLDGFLDNVRERVSSEKGRGASLGETDQELAERIRKSGEEVIAGSGQVVAETEAQAIYGHAQFRALKRAGYKTAFWVTVGDERVRDSHTACEAAGAVKIGDKFPNGLLFPGDPNGGPEEICNCRCWLEGASRR